MGYSLAVQGIGGMNSFSAGFLYQLRQSRSRPDIISVTSGGIRVLHHFLDDDPEALARHYKISGNYQKGLVSKEVQGFMQFCRYVTTGVPGKFRPVMPWQRFKAFDPADLADPHFWIKKLYPAQLYQSETSPETFETMARRFNNSDIAILTNAYDYTTGRAVILVNGAAIDYLKGTRFQPGLIEEFDIRPLDANGLRGALQLIQFGPFQGLYDGAYQYNPFMPPLKKSQHVVLVTLTPLSKPIKPIESFFDIEDFKIKMMFLNAVMSEISNIRMVNRLIEQKVIVNEDYRPIRLDIAEPSLHKGLFDYFVEDEELFIDGTEKAKRIEPALPVKKAAPASAPVRELALADT